MQDKNNIIIMVNRRAITTMILLKLNTRTHKDNSFQANTTSTDSDKPENRKSGQTRRMPWLTWNQVEFRIDHRLIPQLHYINATPIGLCWNMKYIINIFWKLYVLIKKIYIYILHYISDAIFRQLTFSFQFPTS